MRSHPGCPWLFQLAALSVCTLAPATASAQLISRFALRAEVGAGPMISDVQRTRLGYEGVNWHVAARLAFNVVDALSIQASLGNGFFPRSAQGSTEGRTLAVMGGLRFEPQLGRVGRIWIDTNVGLVSTGAQRVLGLDAGLGFEFRLASWLGLGPAARLNVVFADTSVNDPSNATSLSFGASLTLRVPSAEPPPPPVDTDGDGVFDPDDQCVTIPQGETRDPARPGCPIGDADGDGINNNRDQCVDVPMGPRPDPARLGCPLLDRDGDGVLDPQDQCPDQPRGPNPDPARAGCPAGDRDGDGVLDPLDQCPDVSRMPFPDPQRPGCCLPDADHDLVPEPPDACPGVPGVPSRDPTRNGCPSRVVGVGGGQIRITQQIFFDTDRDTIKRRSDRVLRAVAEVLTSAPVIRRVSIDGHTDDRATMEHNMDLSQRRAAAVVRWLVEHGVEASRLESHGYGPTRPIADNASGRGRARNRRVEFLILDPAPPPGAATTASTSPPGAPPRRGRRSGRPH